MSVCVSVKSHLTSGASVRLENAVTHSAGNEGQKIVAFSLKLLRCRDRALPPLDGIHRVGQFSLRITRMRIVHRQVLQGSRAMLHAVSSPCILYSFTMIINYRHACATSVTVVVVSVCVSVCPLSHISPLECLFVVKTLPHTQYSTKVKKYVAFSLKLRRSRAKAFSALYGYRAVGHFLSAEYARALLKCHVDREAGFGQ